MNLTWKTTENHLLEWLTFYRLGWVEFYRYKKLPHWDSNPQLFFQKMFTLGFEPTTFLQKIGHSVNSKKRHLAAILGSIVTKVDLSLFCGFSCFYLPPALLIISSTHYLFRLKLLILEENLCWAFASHVWISSPP